MRGSHVPSYEERLIKETEDRLNQGIESLEYDLNSVEAIINERLDVIEAKLDALVGLLPQEQFLELRETVQSIKERAWERRMGDDL